MGMSNSSTSMHMATTFTTALGSSTLWFNGWTPTSPGATFAASLGLALVAVLSRFLTALKVCAEIAWHKSLHERQLRAAHRTARLQQLEQRDDDPDKATPPPQDRAEVPAADSADAPAYARTPSSASIGSVRAAVPVAIAAAPAAASSFPVSPPFTLAVDLPRSLLFGFQAFLSYLLMLAVMTYNAYFFIAILVGLIVGELAFGRYIALLGGSGTDAHGGHDFSGAH